MILKFFNPEVRERLIQNNLWIFLFYTLVAGLIYFVCRYAGFVTDFIGFEQGYDKCGYFHIYDCANLKNFRYLQHLFSYILYETAGSDTIYWYLLYTLAHGAASTAIYVFLKTLFKPYISRSAFLAFISGFLFLVSPYQSEVVVWKVCIQYCVVVITVFFSLYILMIDLQKPNKSHPFLVMFLFLFGLFSLEQTVILPFAMFLLVGFYWIGSQYLNFKKRFFSYYFIPQLLCVIGFFSLSKIFYGKWVMHYGAKSFVHLISFETLGKIYTYFFKPLFLIREWPHEWKTHFVQLMESPYFNIPFTVILLFLLIYLIYDYTKGRIMSGILSLLIMLYVLSILPVVQLYMTMLLRMEGDRLGYVSSAFVFSILVLSLNTLKPNFKNTLLFLVIVANLGYAFFYAFTWSQSKKVMDQYLDSFNNTGSNKIFVLAIPDNYKGFLEFRRYGDESGLEEALQYRKKSTYAGRIIEIVQFNQMTLQDGVKVSEVNDSTLHIEFSQYGNWFWREGIGASDHETSDFNFDLMDWGYNVVLRKFDRNKDIILYPKDGKFSEFHFK